MKQDEQYYLVFKFILIAILLISGFIASYDAGAVYKIKEIKSKSGQKFIRVINKTNKNIYCVATGKGYWKDFTVYAKRTSRHHIKPLKDFRIVCK